jgi:hypothetical protein
VPRQRAGEFLARLKKGLVNDGERLTLRRSLNDLLRIEDERSVHTDWELREALTRVALGELSLQKAAKEYGASVSTLQRGLKRLKLVKLDGEGAPLETDVRERVGRLEFKRAGRPPLLSRDTEALVLLKAAAARTVGCGQSGRAVRRAAKAVALAEAGVLDQRCSRAQNLKLAKFSRGWFTGARARLQADGHGSAKLHNDSMLAAKRAAAGAMHLNVAMVAKIEAMYQDAYEKGKMPTARPEAWQIYTADEIGFAEESAPARLSVPIRADENQPARASAGTWSKSFTVVGGGCSAPRGERAFTIGGKDGGKAGNWTSVLAARRRCLAAAAARGKLARRRRRLAAAAAGGRLARAGGAEERIRGAERGDAEAGRRGAA